MTAKTSSAPATGRRRVILAGLAVVGTAAAVLSFDTINSLAEAAGFTANWTIGAPGAHTTLRISWLVPVAVDAFGLLATMAWLTPTFSEEIRQYARVIAVADIFLSAVLNALFHGMKAAKWIVADCWPVVIGVGAIPPVFLALALHLGSLVMAARTAAASDEPESGPVLVPTADGPLPVSAAAFADMPAADQPAPVLAEGPAVALPGPVHAAAQDQSTPAPEEDRPDQSAETGELDQPEPVRRTTRTARPKTTRRTSPKVRSIESGTDARLDRLRKAYPHSVPSNGDIKTTLGIKSQGTANNLRKALIAERTTKEAQA